MARVRFDPHLRGPKDYRTDFGGVQDRLWSRIDQVGQPGSVGMTMSRASVVGHGGEVLQVHLVFPAGFPSLLACLSPRDPQAMCPLKIRRFS